MTDNKDFKQVVRARALSRGQSYAAARRQLLTPPPVAGGAGQKPAHWGLAGSHPGQYSHEIEPNEQYQGKPVARLTYTASGTPEGFGTTIQSFGGAEFVGHRVRFTGVLRAHDVDDWAGLWIRVDGAGNTSLSFDNMQDRPISGTTDWVPCDLVVAAPKGTSRITCGALLQGRGSISIADLAITKVDESVPLTGVQSIGPKNLDFADLVPST